MNRFIPYPERYAANMRRVAADAEHQPEWKDYADYCSLRAEGRRADAFAALRLFLKRTAVWSTIDKRRFLVWLHGLSGEGDFLPFPLTESLDKPTLQEWASLSPLDPEPLVLLGDVESRWKAWHLASLDPGVALAFIQRAVPYLEVSAHELPSGWVGEDLASDRCLLGDVLSASTICLPTEELMRLRQRAQAVQAKLLAYLGESA